MSEFQKYPEAKRKFDIGYLRAFGCKCPMCKGSGKEHTMEVGSYTAILMVICHLSGYSGMSG